MRPVTTGVAGKAALREFYSRHFIPSMPPETALTPISGTVGERQLVDEMIFSLTHTQETPWMLSGVAPTPRHIEVALMVIVFCSPIPHYRRAESKPPKRKEAANLGGLH